jgi:hypothetical protein
MSYEEQLQTLIQISKKLTPIFGLICVYDELANDFMTTEQQLDFIDEYFTKSALETRCSAFCIALSYAMGYKFNANRRSSFPIEVEKPFTPMRDGIYFTDIDYNDDNNQHVEIHSIYCGSIWVFGMNMDEYDNMSEDEDSEYCDIYSAIEYEKYLTELVEGEDYVKMAYAQPRFYEESIIVQAALFEFMCIEVKLYEYIKDIDFEYEGDDKTLLRLVSSFRSVFSPYDIFEGCSHIFNES